MNKLIFGGTIVLSTILWWLAYVGPHDQARYQIIECMNSHQQTSEEAYETCFEKLRDARRRKR